MGNRILTCRFIFILHTEYMKSIFAILAAAVIFLGMSGVADAATRVRGYYRSNGTYVQPYYRSNSNYSRWDNYSTWGNYNPYTGKKGYISPFKSYRSYRGW